MVERRPTINELLRQLGSEGLITDDGLRKAADHISLQAQTPSDPIYIKLLSGFGAWVAAPFLFMFLALIHVIGDDPQKMFVVGLLSLVATVVLARVSKNTFLSQFALAMSFAGHFLILASFDKSGRVDKMGILAVTQSILCILVYPFFPNVVYRFAMPLFAVGLGLGWAYESKHAQTLNLFVAVQMLACGWFLFWDKKPPSLRPLQYVFAVGLPATVLFMTFINIFMFDLFGEPKFFYWPARAILAAGLIVAMLKLGGWSKSLKKEWMIMAIIVTCLFGAFTTPGILVAIGLLALGYGLSDKILTAIALIFFAVFLVLFYYALDVTLLHKSYILAGSGLGLLLVRWVLGSRPWAKELAQ
jgi:hypothetical protein